jgi:hypothetical protein
MAVQLNDVSPEPKNAFTINPEFVMLFSVTYVPSVFTAVAVTTGAEVKADENATFLVPPEVVSVPDNILGTAPVGPVDPISPFIKSSCVYVIRVTYRPCKILATLLEYCLYVTCIVSVGPSTITVEKELPPKFMTDDDIILLVFFFTNREG